MPKRKPSSSDAPRAVLVLLATAVILFVGGEALLLSRTEPGQLVAAKYLHLGDHARVTMLVGKQIRRGLKRIGVPPDSIQERVVERGTAPVRWRIGLRPDASLLKANYVIAKFLDDRGVEVLSGRERSGDHGDLRVTLEVGFRGRPTHELLLVRGPHSSEAAAARTGRVALVLFGFGDDLERAKAFFDLPVPFAVALAPGEKYSPALFRAARERRRELVLHLPLEPINYPRVDPGPGTILVTMKPTRISELTRRYLDQAGPVAAVANYMGSLATQDMSVMAAVYRELRRRRLPFLHVTPAPGSVCKPLAADLGVAYEEPDAVIDAETRQSGPKALDARWNQVLERTGRRAQMVVLMRATPLVSSWLPRALASGRLKSVEIVPVTAAMQQPAAL